VLLAGCTRYVSWEEEVPLNTGETIVVERSGSYSWRSESGNPLKYGYRPDWRRTIEFTYRGKTYTHTDDAHMVLLAISPQGVPNLLAIPSSTWASRNSYYCAVPYYVQFQPDPSGKQWSWPAQIEPWTHGIETNLMFGAPDVGTFSKRYTPEERWRHNASSLVAFEHRRRIDPTYRKDGGHISCLERK